jgi:predicted  nucleic acid-binding Zn-ribbon protein
MVEQLRRRVREQLTNKETECEDITAQVTNLKHELSMSVGKTEQLQRQMEDESSDRSTSHDLIVTRYREQTTSKELECVELQDQVRSLPC